MWQKFFEADRYRRKKFRFRTKKKPHGRRPIFSREDLSSYLKNNNIYTTWQLNKVRKEGDPNVYDYRKKYGTWTDAIFEIYKTFGINKNKPFYDAQYLAKLILEMNLWNLRAYRKARKLRPDIVPSTYWVEKEYGNFTKLWYITRQYSLCINLDRYVALKRKLGRIPTLDECDTYKIDLTRALKFFKNKPALDRYVGELVGDKNAQ